MNILRNVSLQHYNTFGLAAQAEYFYAFDSIANLQEVLADPQHKKLDRFILGGGSNILLTKDVSGLVLKNELLGYSVVKEDEAHVYVKAGAGMVWHDFVLYCIANGYAGVENLSLIPGNVGASPMQNIGAYGVEIKSVFESLEALHIETGKLETFTLEQCEFGYRESVFKRKLKGQYVICSVTFKLNKVPQFNTSYGAIEQELERMQVKDLSIKAVSDAVINIRKSKLPDPLKIGNSGSFFKNPVVKNCVVDRLKGSYPSIPIYPVSDTHSKVAAGWLIEQAGWKGKRFGNYGVHDKQALVLVHYGGHTGKEIFDLSEDILQSVNEKFGITLEREVNII